MHTLVITSIGLILLAVCLVIAPRKDAAAARFIPAWLLVSIAHLSYGVIKAGYPLKDELLVHVVVFGLPAATAWVLSRKLRPKN